MTKSGGKSTSIDTFGVRHTLDPIDGLRLISNRKIWRTVMKVEAIFRRAFEPLLVDVLEGLEGRLFRGSIVISLDLPIDGVERKSAIVRLIDGLEVDLEGIELLVEILEI